MTASPTERTRFSAHRLAEIALLGAMALAVQWLEGLLPPVLPMIPVRLGLANVFVLFALLRNGRGDALLVTLLRTTLYLLIAGNPMQYLYSLAGALLAFLSMSLLLAPLRSGRISAVGLSVAGAFFFNVGQLAVGCLAAGSAMLAYLPWMGLLSIPAGMATGASAMLLVHRIPKR